MANAPAGSGIAAAGLDAVDRRARAAPAPPLDEAAFERFYARTSRPLWAYVYRTAGDPAVADDVHQESYLRYLANACPAAGERQQSAYLFRIATNLLHDRWRREKRERGWLDQLLGRSPEVSSGGEGVGTRLDVTAVLDQLQPRQRALLWLAYVEGRRHTEIAEILGVKAASVRVLLFRARRRMAALLAKHGLTHSEIGLEVHDAK